MSAQLSGPGANRCPGILLFFLIAIFPFKLFAVSIVKQEGQHLRVFYSFGTYSTGEVWKVRSDNNEEFWATDLTGAKAVGIYAESLSEGKYVQGGVFDSLSDWYKETGGLQTICPVHISNLKRIKITEEAKQTENCKEDESEDESEEIKEFVLMLLKRIPDPDPVVETIDASKFGNKGEIRWHYNGFFSRSADIRLLLKD